MNIKVKKLNEKAILPVWNNMSAGCDLSSTEFYILKPGERKLFKTGLSIAIPTGFYGRIAPRSGLAFKNGIDVLAGVIDEDYRGDVGVILINLGQEDKNILVGDKIAQLIFENYTRFGFVETDNLDETDRGDGGYGSTDKISVKFNLPPSVFPPSVFPLNESKNYEFKLDRQITIDDIVKDQKIATSLKSYFRNFQGEIYSYTENGRTGACIVDSSGEVQAKYQL